MDKGVFRFYMPGLGTPFPEIKELTETQDGKAFGKGGQPRIIWALLQVLNATYGVVNGGKVLRTDGQVGDLANDHNQNVGQSSTDVYGQQTTITHKSWFEPHIAELASKLKNTKKPEIPSLTLSVFGFSRGAAEAAAFCHMFDELLVDNKLAGIPATISFLGVFDTVASIGLSASVGRTTPLSRSFADGHFSWAKRILKPLPACVKAGRHFIASQEIRMNFPVTRLRSEHGDFHEVYFPGMHSDVGGGYGPGEAGKGRDSQSSLVSQIPLVHMFKEARVKGVPLMPFSEFEPLLKNDYSVNQELASAWNAYTAELGNNGDILMKHMELYYRWRAARLNNLEKTASYAAASDQSKQDMSDANRMLAGDLEVLKYRKNVQPKAAGDDTGYEPCTLLDQNRINQWQLSCAMRRNRLDEWEKWALEIFENPEPLPPEVMRFFDDYIHDSYAGFYLAGEVTEYDRRKKVSEVVKKDRRSLKGFDLKIYDHAKKTEAALNKQKAGEALDEDEEKLVKEAEFGTPYPVMTDNDTADMRSIAIETQTWTRREGGGYFLPRGNYPLKGPYGEEILRKPRPAPETEKAAA
ncbi:phospholipase effector Tle1 domain-containing protein [Pseudoduganella violaceinigra]|uniref:phospholipase effector Tle1 domain-containing protein n=1 Tax=Pseudoduganella violaceinigra TaxID=246602 RepID=UPI0035316935